MVRKKNNTRRRRTRARAGRVMAVRLPAPFNRVGSDMMAIHGSGMVNCTSNSTDTKGSLFMSPLSTSVATLATLMPSLAGIATAYERFIIRNLRLKLVPASSYLSGAVFAAGFVPQRDTESTNPTTYNAVMTSAHNCLTTATNIGSFSCRPMDYVGDWCIINGTDLQKYNGYVRWYSAYNGGAVGTTTAYLDVEFDIVFAGLKNDVGTV